MNPSTHIGCQEDFKPRVCEKAVVAARLFVSPWESPKSSAVLFGFPLCVVSRCRLMNRGHAEVLLLFIHDPLRTLHAVLLHMFQPYFDIQAQTEQRQSEKKSISRDDGVM